MADKAVLSLGEFERHGVDVRGKRMLNTGEHRFTLRLAEGGGVSITKAGEQGGWQEAHYHVSTREVYAVHDGLILYAWDSDRVDAGVELLPLRAGQQVVAEPGISHAIYVCKRSVFSTMKLTLPGYVFPDYHPDPRIDNRIAKLPVDLIRLHTGT